MDQPYCEVNRSFAVRWKDELEHIWHLLGNNDNMHFVTYNQDLVSPTLLARWTKVKDFYRLTGNYQVTMTHFGQTVFFLTIFKNSSEPKDVPSTMYSFMKAVGFTHLNLEGITECRIVYNHWRKTAKNGN
ncbi:hypothetical protein HKD37_10G028669 [Glycine soja]